MARRLLILLGALAFALALPAAARAATLCVHAPGCAGEPHDTLQLALTAADAAAGPDRIEVGPGEYAGPFTADEDNVVELVGVGEGETVLSAPGDDVTVVSLAAPGSTLRRVRVRLATGVGVRLINGGTLENSTVALTGPGTGVGVGPGSTSSVTATLRHVTLAGTGTDTDSGTGLDVTASATSAASVTLSSSVITRFTVPIRATDGDCPTAPCPAATVSTEHSAFDPASTSPPDTWTAAVATDPILDAGLRPVHDSPLIDAAGSAPDAELDASGLPRVIDGDGNLSEVADIGALEYQRRPPQITAALAAPTSAVAGATIGFGAAATDPDGEALDASWAFSDGAAATGWEIAHTFGAPGAASATVTVTDPAGLSATATVAVTITAAPPSGGDPPPVGGNPPTAGGDPPPSPRRVLVIARVLPTALKLRADKRRDKRPPYRFRLRGRVVLPEGISAAGCAGGAVQLAIRAGKRRMSRSVKLAPDCSFRAKLKLGRKRARRVVVRPRFGGTGALAPLDGRKLRLRAG